MDQDKLFDELSVKNAEHGELKYLVDSMFSSDWDDLRITAEEANEWTRDMNRRIKKIMTTLMDIRASFNSDKVQFVSKVNDFDIIIKDIRQNFSLLCYVIDKMAPKLAESIQELRSFI